ncbi:MAG TPA: alpha/beta hydrolase family protein [Opitutales bacterium]|jgi:dienelactone hydrolase|nr:alpha/beta hydrolase family protein [Opitutales bacterium]
MRRIALLSALLLTTLAHPLQAMTDQERQDYLRRLLQILPPVDATANTPSFNDWLATSKQLPPDFDALPRHNALPDPLQFLDGHFVKTTAEWPARRQEIIDLEEKYQLGTLPPKPKLDSVTVISETVSDGVTPPAGGGGFTRGPAAPLPMGTITRVVQLAYGPNDQATTRVTITIPVGDGPFPVLIGSSTAKLVNRGYIGCNFPNSVDAPTVVAPLYPNYDFATMGQQAFIAQMVVDYLYTVPQVDKARIAITGYSRLGKMALTAAALDTRIAAVVAGSTGVGGVFTWRQGGERNQAESIETTTRMFPLWMAPQLRFFAGREDRLPIDGNCLVALVAPRGCLIEYGMNDEVSNIWGCEQTMYSVEPLYKMLGKPDAVGIMRVPGVHGANNEDMYLDWLDIQFGRSQDKWVNSLLFPWNFQNWVAQSGDKVDLSKFPAHKPDDLLVGSDGKTISSTAAWDAKAADIRKNINWLLGDAPATIPQAGGPTDLGSSSKNAAAGGRVVGGVPGARGAAGGGNAGVGDSVNDVIKHFFTGAGTEFGWTAPQRNAMATRQVIFGEGIKGDLYYPANTPPGTKLPTVVWLHGFSYPLGYMWVYRRDLHPIIALTQAGYAVLAYDQCGFGIRASEIGPFFDTAPHWSQMGRLVHDARSALDALAKDDVVDPNELYLYGYELGATVGLYTAALDPRVKGVVSINGNTPMRTDTADHGTGGIARWSIERPLIPRLGFFIGHEAQIPVDYPEIIAAIAPRPVVIVEPKLDRDINSADVHAALDQVSKVYTLYHATANLMVDEPWDYARFPAYTQGWTIDSLNWAAHPAPPATAPTAGN